MKGSGMRATFDNQLTDLHARLLSLGRMVQGQLDDALAALAGGDTDAAEQVVGRDQQVNQDSAEIEWGLLCTLARQAPVAGDLRLVAGLLHVNEHLERMGDLCANLAKAVPELADRPPPTEVRVTLTEMGGQVSRVVAAALACFADRERAFLITARTDTGKTTTTFTKQNGSLPVQDDFVAWMPDGRIMATENGCFAKTFGLNPDDEPTIHGAVTQPDSYLENVSQHGDEPDFYDTSYTQNGRATFPFRVIDAAADRDIDDAHFLLILNRNENVIPAVAKLEGPLAAAFFMLGETQGTSAGGADEAGKFLRVPGTNPFFPAPHDLQGNRFLELLEEHPLEVYLMNTGRVGGAEDDERSKKVKIRHSSAIVKAIAEGTISWERDPHFGYLVASDVPGVEDVELLQPRLLYERTGQRDFYEAGVERLKAGRAEFLSDFPSLSEEIVAAVR